MSKYLKNYHQLPFAQYWKRNYKEDSIFIPLFSANLTDEENQAKTLSFLANYWSSFTNFLFFKMFYYEDYGLEVCKKILTPTIITYRCKDDVFKLLTGLEIKNIYITEKGTLTMKEYALKNNDNYEFTGNEYKHIFDINSPDDYSRSKRPFKLKTNSPPQIFKHDLRIATPFMLMPKRLEFLKQLLTTTNDNWRKNINADFTPVEVMGVTNSLLDSK